MNIKFKPTASTMGCHRWLCDGLKYLCQHSELQI